jgi:hypothetical protein
MAKAPSGFPLDPNKWTVETVDTSTRSQSSPTAGVWYNPGSLGITIPIGIWRVRYQGNIGFLKAGNTDQSVYSTLSTANNSESNTRFTAAFLRRNTGASANYGYAAAINDHIIVLSAKTQYYLNIKTIDAEDSISVQGTVQPTVIQAISDYL